MDHIKILVEFRSANDQSDELAQVSTFADTAVTNLRASGLDLRPSYTGAMGGELYEVIQQLADGAAQNSTVVLALITSVAAPIATALAGRLKKQLDPVTSTVSPVVVIVGSTSVLVEDDDIDDGELLRRLLAEDPTLASHIDPSTPVIIKAQVPSSPIRRRR